jgi:hypothetical protein
VQFTIGDAFDSFDFSTLRFDTEYQTTVDWSVIDNDGTGTAIPIVATFFTAG